MAERPRFSLISAVYDVEPYLDEFIASIEAQGLPASELEVIVVDDGSTDGSLARLEAWRDASSIPVTVLHQPNAGQGAARNRGLAVATGEWVSFPDPDDVLEPGYLRALLRFADANPRVEMLGAAIRVLHDVDGSVTDDHPRAWQFQAGTRLVDLTEEPEVFPQTASRASFRLDTLRATGLTFDEELKPNFEDVHFSAAYLLALPRPVAGLVAEARYRYRIRVAGSSTMQHAYLDPRRYTTVLDRGYLDLIARAREHAGDGSVPAWLQHLLLYDVTFYLRENDRLISRVRFPAELAAPFHQRIGEVARALDPAVVAAHRGESFTTTYRDLLVHGYRPEPWHADPVEITASDAVRGLQQVAYRYTGPPPEERFIVDGTERTPAFAKRRGLVYYDRLLMEERIAWLPAGRLEVALDGTPVGIARGGRRLRPGASAKPLAPVPAPPAPGIGARVRRRVVPRYVRARGRRFDGAWLLADRIGAAGGNAESLLVSLLEAKVGNPWLVVERASPDWARLSATHGERLVAMGSSDWALLVANASWALVSVREPDVIRAPEILGHVMRPHLQLGLLGDGVAVDDGSRQLRPGTVDLFLTTTPAETAAFVADGTPFALTAKEVARTGMPRLDRLRALADGAVSPDLVLVAPDTRDWLTVPLDAEHGRIDRLARPTAGASDYAKRWRALLAAPGLAEAAAQAGLRVGFLPHPDLASVLDASWLPVGVELLPAVGDSLPAQLARAAVLVTDYRPLAFDIASIDRPVAYYQFDAAERGIGDLRGRSATYDYARDGFGPVVTDAAALVEAVADALAHGPGVASPYAERIATAFPDRATPAWARVVEAIRERSRPWGDASG